MLSSLPRWRAQRMLQTGTALHLWPVSMVAHPAHLLQVAHFLGDVRLPLWIQLAVQHLQGLLASTSDAALLFNSVAATEGLSMDVLDALLEYLPLSTTLTHLSPSSHVRALQLRMHQDEHGPHLHVEVNASFSEAQSTALTAAVQDLPASLQPVTVTLKPGGQRAAVPCSLLADDWGAHCQEGLNGPQGPQSPLLHIAGVPLLLRLSAHTLECSVLYSGALACHVFRCRAWTCCDHHRRARTWKALHQS